MGRNDINNEIFGTAYGIENTNQMTKELAVKALVQYQKAIISENSEHDQTLLAEVQISLSDEEFEGKELLFVEASEFN